MPLLILALLSAQVRAQLSGDFLYRERAGEITIVQYPPNLGGPVSVPSTIAGKPVTEIGQRAFFHCELISSISLPSSIHTLGHEAFFGCESLTSFTIPRSVASIGSRVFSGCDELESINVSPQNVYFSSSNGILYNRSRTELIHVPEFKSGDITIPTTVKTLGDQSIRDCSRIRTVTVPASVTDLGSAMFYDCVRLTAIMVDPANAAFSSVDGLLFDKGLSALLRCPGGKTGYVELALGTNVAPGAFSASRSIEGISLPDATASIPENMFADCASLRNFDIPEGVTSIGRAAFARCFALEEIDIPDSVEAIGDNVFYVCSSLARVRLPSSLTAIGSGWFHACESLEEVVIPDGVISIGPDAFSSCHGLTNIILPESVRELGIRAFFNTGLRTVRVPAAVESIGLIAFSLCPDLVEIEVSEGNLFFRSIDGILYSRDLTQLIQCPAGRIGSVTVPASVSEVPMNAFSGCELVTRVRFMGDAPSWGPSGFNSFEVIYFDGRSGFDGATWMGYAAISDGQPTPIGTWLVSHELAYDSDLSTGPGRSGVGLWLAYALDLDPHANPAGHLPQVVMGADSLSLTYFADQPGVRYHAECSTSLEAWRSEGITLSDIDQNGFRTASCPLTAEALFMRLRVSPR